MTPKPAGIRAGHSFRFLVSVWSHVHRLSSTCCWPSMRYVLVRPLLPRVHVQLHRVHPAGGSSRFGLRVLASCVSYSLARLGFHLASVLIRR